MLCVCFVWLCVCLLAFVKRVQKTQIFKLTSYSDTSWHFSPFSMSSASSECEIFHTFFITFYYFCSSFSEANFFFFDWIAKHIFKVSILTLNSRFDHQINCKLYFKFSIETFNFRFLLYRIVVISDLFIDFCYCLFLLELKYF